MREVARRMGLPMRSLSAAGPVLDQPGQGLELVVDGLLGTGFQGELSADMLAAVRTLNSLRGPLRVALDLPSGMDADTGAPRPEAVRAHLTLSFAAPKLGFLAPGTHAWLGRTIVLGIGAPPQLALRVQHLG
jgi:NAD(P)H-hydrate epimerase